MRAGLLVLVIAACGPRVANTPRIVEDDLDMPPPGAIERTGAPAGEPAPPPAGPAPLAASAPAVTGPTQPTATEPARPVAPWPPASRPVTEPLAALPDSQRAVAPPGKGLRTGTIARARLLTVLNAGPGHFLRQLEVTPRLSGDRFVGWQLVQLIDRSGPLGDVDLASGDILLAINGNPLARPEHLQAVWDALRTANEVTAHLWRGDQKFDLRFKIEPQAP